MVRNIVESGVFSVMRANFASNYPEPSAVASQGSVWDSDDRSPRPLSGHMRLRSSLLRLLTLAGSVALLSLLPVSPADAAPRRGTSGPLCDPQAPLARKMPRHPKSFGGPVKQQNQFTFRIGRGWQETLGRIKCSRRVFIGNVIVEEPASGLEADLLRQGHKAVAASLKKRHRFRRRLKSMRDDGYARNVAGNLLGFCR